MTKTFILQFGENHKTVTSNLPIIFIVRITQFHTFKLQVFFDDQFETKAIEIQYPVYDLINDQWYRVLEETWLILCRLSILM